MTIKTFMPTAISSDGKPRKSAKKNLCSVLKSSGQITYRSKGKVLYCLTLNGRFLKDHTGLLVTDNSALLTDNPSESLRFIDQEVAIARASALQKNGLEIEIKFEIFPYR
jgi:hypothetical protein